MAIYEFEGKAPRIGDGTFIHPEAVLIGAVTIGRGCFIGAGAVLRADFGEIFVGDGSNVQENAVLHASPIQPVRIENDAIVAHGALLHDATIRRGAVVGMGAVILHRAVVEEDAVVGAGSVVSPGFVVPAHKIAFGNPAQIQKDVSDDALQITKIGLAMYQELPERCRKGLKRLDPQPV
jgi:carbonic anhydrase/acetyltransferase-like protein (isoleucine patch superfamily)